ncbi:uncharacterized protein LOC133818464 isoform X1 [Humulus lupulus]|uniref:uncharacterized protein LOC133818464 isoform X1 n=1 Tax=Humulus lupulus TaxID=3486 RepID=UPI002B403FEE|nr:uncharacterized protein LOC133818464 isoform X1 [Humulus lupulus]
MVFLSGTLGFKCPQALAFCSKIHMDFKPRSLHSPFSRSPPREVRISEDGEDGSVITLQEWQGWGTTSPLPIIVTRIADDLKDLEKDNDAQMTFGGKGGKLQGEFKKKEDKKHRATYKDLGDSEQKLQFFSARQIACRLLGSRGYLCQKCWLPHEDCMCSKVTPCKLWHGIRLWLYMHPKDFLRQNNTGKLLWQLFGVEAATLCLFGIAEHEEIMWNAFKCAGKDKVWCLYPNKNAVVKSVQEAFDQGLTTDLGFTETTTNGDDTLNFVLIDGTWSNSAAMVRRLKDQAKLAWGEEDICCISLATGASAMHKLRPQPSWDRTCTAAAAIGLLYELQLLPKFCSIGLDKQAEAIEDALAVLLDALTARRLRMGRSITRKMRHHSDIC